MKRIYQFVIAMRRWMAYVATPNVYPKRWQDRLFHGHVNIGRITIFGANAMHWAINIRGQKNWWCFHWRTRTFGAEWPWYFYISPDATPYSAVFRTGARFKSRRLVSVDRGVL